jgi:hypothetical protein
MSSKHDVLGVRTGLKDSWARQPIAGATSIGADGTTERHVCTDVDGDKPVRSVKDFVCNETASGHTQEASQDCLS